jgi:hypothetical protein
MDLPFETGAGRAQKLDNLWQRYESYRTGRTSSGEVVTELSIVVLKRDIMDFYVDECLKAQGVNTNDLQQCICGLVNKVRNSSAPLRFDLIVQALLKNIQQGHETPRALIERVPLKDYEHAAQHHQGSEQTMEDLIRLLGPRPHARIIENHAGKAMASEQISHKNQDVVHPGLAASVLGLSPLPQARAGALTDEGQRKTIANQWRPAFGLSGVMADDLSAAADESERVGFLRNVQKAGSGAAAGAVSRIRKSPVATVAVVGGTVITGAVYFVCDKFKASAQPASDAALDVTPPAVTDLAWVPDLQQSGSGTSEKEAFGPGRGPYIGYRPSESAEEADRLRENSELDVLNQFDKKPGPGYQPSAENGWQRSESPEVEVLNR